MTISVRAVGGGLIVVALASGCVSDGPDHATPDGSTPAPEIGVTVPPQRLTPFCQAMIDLSDRLRTGDVSSSETLIIETYRSVSDQVPIEIAADFDAVLAALESGAPPPTDPAPETVVTSPPPSSTSSTTSTSTSTSAPISAPAPTEDSSAPSTLVADRLVDEGFAPAGSPAERVNGYVDFACRATENNPGPPATQPQGEAPATTIG